MLWGSGTCQTKQRARGENQGSGFWQNDSVETAGGRRYMEGRVMGRGECTEALVVVVEEWEV